MADIFTPLAAQTAITLALAAAGAPGAQVRLVDGRTVNPVHVLVREAVPVFITEIGALARASTWVSPAIAPPSATGSQVTGAPPLPRFTALEKRAAAETWAAAAQWRGSHRTVLLTGLVDGLKTALTNTPSRIGGDLDTQTHWAAAVTSTVQLVPAPVNIPLLARKISAAWSGADEFVGSNPTAREPLATAWASTLAWVWGRITPVIPVGTPAGVPLIPQTAVLLP